MKRTCCIVVDDENIFKELTYILEPLGYTTHLAHSSGDLINTMKSLQEGLILYDISMVDDQILLHLKEFGNVSSGITCLYLARSSQIDSVITALETSGDGFITMPFTTGEVVFRVLEAVAKKHLLERVADTEDKYQALYDSMNEGVALHEMIYDDKGKPIDYRILDVNLAYENILRMDSELLVGKTIRELLNIDEPPYLRIFSRVINTGLPTNFDTYDPERDMHMSISVFTPGKARFATVITDITERKRAEEAKKEYTRKLEILNRIFSSSNRNEDLQSFLDDILSLSIDLLGFDGAFFHMIDNEMKTARLRCSRKISPPLQKYLEEIDIDTEPYDRILRKAQPIFSSRSREVDPLYQDRWGFHSIGFIPLFLEDRVLGSMGVLKRKPHVFTSEEKYILQSIVRETVSVVSKMQMADALKESEERYRDLFENANDLIQIVAPDGKILFVNKKWRETLGYTKDEIKELSIFDVVCPEDREHCLEMFKQVMQGSPLLMVETRFVKKDGSEILVEGSASCKFQDGMPVSTRGIFRDITNRKKMAMELKEKEELYRTIIENKGEGMSIVDVNEVFIYANPMAHEILGVEDGELVGRCLRDFMNEDMFSIAQEWTEQRRLGEKGSYELEIIRPDGEKRIIYITSTPKYDHQGEFSGTIGIFHDMTDRILMKRALIESEEKFRTLLENIPTCLYMTTHDGRFISMNPGAPKMFGYKDIDEMMKTSVKDCYATLDDRAELISELDKNGYVKNMEIQLKKKDGSVFWALVNANTVYDAGGSVLYYNGAIEDITQRKLFGENLKKSEEKFRNIVEASPLGIHMYHLNDNDQLIFSGANSAADKLLGVDNSIFIGKTIEEAFPPLAETEVPERYRIVAKEGIHWKTEQINYKDEKIQGTFEVHAFQTSPGKMVAMFQDVTEKEKMKQALEIERAYFHELFQNAPEALALTDNDGRLRDVNLQFTRLFGYTKEEVIGKDTDELIATDDLREEGKKATLDVAQGETVMFETQRVRRDGKRVNVSVLGSPIMVGSKQVGVYAIYRNITDRMKAIAALEESEEQYRSLVENANDAIYVLQDNKFVFMNNSFYEMFGYTEEEMNELGTFMDLVHKESYQFINERAERLNKGEDLPSHYEFLGRAKDGKKLHLDANIVTIQYQGKPARQGIIRDVTDTVIALEKARELEKMKSEYVQLISHELGTPLMIIEGWLQYLLEGNEGMKEEDQEAISIIQSNLKRLQKLKNAMFYLSLLEQDRFKPHREPIFIQQVIREVFQEFAMKSQQKSIMLEMDVSGLPIIMADEERIHEVITILVDNAMKFTPEGGKIKVSGTESEFGIEIEIKDNGIGIPQQEQEKIFDRFYQGREVTRQAKGFGLGLSVAKGIIESHDGKIWVESEVGNGSAFHFSIPIRIKEISDNGA